MLAAPATMDREAAAIREIAPLAEGRGYFVKQVPVLDVKAGVVPFVVRNTGSHGGDVLVLRRMLLQPAII